MSASVATWRLTWRLGGIEWFLPKSASSLVYLSRVFPKGSKVAMRVYSLHSTHFLTFETDKIELSNSYHLSSQRTPKVLMNFRNKWKRFIRFISEWLKVCNYTHICSIWEIVTRLTPKSKFQDPTQLLILKSPVSCWGPTLINIPVLSL